MAGIAFGSVEKIVKVALAIKEAVETVKQNHRECHDIGKCAARCSALLQQLGEKTGIMKDEAMRGPLEDVTESLEEALGLVTECQRKHYVSHLWKAGDIAKQLRQVQEDIVRKLLLGKFATMVQATVILTNIQNAVVPPPPPPTSEEVVPGFTRFNFSDLKIATKDFENIIAKGAFSNVYKGVLHDGQVVAIKKFFTDILMDIEWSIYNEINIFINIKHKNILRPLGYCHETTMVLSGSEGKYVAAKQHQICYVEAYVPNGSLKKIMKDSHLNEWSSCMRIIQGIAQGLHYLHEKCIVHLDLKPDNILMDSDMNPLICDFGVAVMLDHDDPENNHDNSLFGTPGYMAPEYLGEGILSFKGDVYAFGVIVVEMISSMSRFTPPASHDLVGWAKVAQDAGRIKELFGPALVDESQLMEIKRCIEVGLLCTRLNRHKRPTMADVVQMLSGEKELSVPKKPPA